MAIKKPNSKRNLDMTLRRMGESDEDFIRTRTLLANVIVAQMLPNGAVKGGSSLKIRFGDRRTRATIDLDAARANDLDTFIAEFEERLTEGREDFTARLVLRDPASPENVPTSYVMQPFDVKLSYLGGAWCTVPFELGHDEIGDTEEPDMVFPTEAAVILLALGFSEPKPVPLMRLPHQIAQKLHAASAPGSIRAHDLIDLQVMLANGHIDYLATKQTCKRLFTCRKMQSWPPAIHENEN
jgi:Nucleotidyl transferase AbiEii toxin, Type IV TA system